LPRLLWIRFFFSSRRRHTRFSRDWSSDVCSSDLAHHNHFPGPPEAREAGNLAAHRVGRTGEVVVVGADGLLRTESPRTEEADVQIGRASCRERGEIAVVAAALKKLRQPNESSRCC